MAHWFLKNNPRRYFRSDLPLKMNVSIQENRIDRQKCHSGIQFVSNSNLMELRTVKFEVEHALSGISPHGELIETIVSELIEKVDVLLSAIENLQKGEDLTLTGEITAVKSAANGLTTIGTIANQSQKVYSILKGFEYKVSVLASAIIKFNNSTTHTQIAFVSLTKEYPVDKIAEALANGKIKDIALPRAITNLANYIQIVFDAFVQMNQQQYLKDNQGSWPFINCNASACGIAFYSHSKFPPFTKVDVDIDLGRGQIVRFEGKTVCITYCKDRKRNIVAIDFEYPDANVQKGFLRYLQKRELALAFKEWSQ